MRAAKRGPQAGTTPPLAAAVMKWLVRNQPEGRGDGGGICPVDVMAGRRLDLPSSSFPAQAAWFHVTAIHALDAPIAGKIVYII